MEGMVEKQLSRLVPGLLAAALLAGGCRTTVTAPSPGAVVTFAVANETFRVLLTDASQIAAARAAQNGGTARIPNGRIVAGTQVNSGWSWHLEDVEFAAFTIELCDGRPSDVERTGPSYANGRFCPWGATIVRIDER
jgi:hypothetical protein